MRCNFADSLLQGYFDSELRTASAAEFERHLQHCADCANELVEMDILRGRLQLAQLYEAAPPSLRRTIRAKLRPVMPTTAVPQQLIWHWLAAAGALLVLLIVGWRLSPALQSEDYQAELAGEIVDAHVRSLQPDHLTAIDSNDGQVVQGWFKDKVPFALPARDFASDGFALQGARLDVVEDHSVAVLVYANTGHLINVFMWPTQERDTSTRVGSRQGYRWIDWRKGNMEFCVVSDVDRVVLERLRQLINSSA